jgi:hypothetical protein
MATRSEASKARTAKDPDRYQDLVFLNANPTKRDMVELVQRLAYEDEFRAAMEADPTSVLAEYKVNLPAGAFRAGVDLPPKEVLQEALGGFDGGPLNIGPFIAFAAFIAFITK